jgi:hypothetical protein
MSKLLLGYGAFLFMYKEKILQFKEVYIWVKQKKLIKLFYSHKALEIEETRKLQSDLRKIEEAQARLAHLHSIVEKILLRAG